VNAVKGTTLEFDLPFFRICRDAKPHDDRKFRLQIVSGTGNKVDAASDDAANRRASMTSNLIAQLDIDVREVLVADGFLLDKIFPIANQSDYCCLTLLSACGDSF
jgi:hypothetical protein